MTDPLTLLRIVSTILWIWVAWRLRGNLFRSFTKRATHEDPVYGVIAAIGIVTTMLSARYFVFGHDAVDIGERLWIIVCYLITISIQFVILRFAAWGRNAS